MTFFKDTKPDTFCCKTMRHSILYYIYLTSLIIISLICNFWDEYHAFLACGGISFYRVLIICQQILEIVDSCSQMY